MSVSDPNLYLANQLGFVNPLTVIWETIPFSFLLDWVSNVSQFLAQYSEFYGLSLTQQTTTHLLDHVDTSWYGANPVRVNATTVWWTWRRTAGISKPALQLRPLRGLSPTRGLTAAALLLQQLKGH